MSNSRQTEACSTKATHPAATHPAATHPAATHPVVELLRRGATYDERPRQVEVRETHISWVFLTPRHAYKLKKPVRLEFLDFSTPARRRQACEDELRLNRRLAPGVYLAVEPVVRDERGRLRLGGAGEVVDWVVKMRRLPDDRSLDHLIRAGEVAPFEIEQLATRLTDFYLGLPPLTLRADEYRARLRQHVEANRDELLEPRYGLPQALVRRVHAAQLGFLSLSAEQLDERVCDGRVVEGHGDLRPEHIYFHGGPVVIDCIEFNREFRQLDVADELSFLGMECALRGREELGRAILDAYCRSSGDRPADALLGFYGGYRACVRAKVAAIRAGQAGSGAGQAESGATRAAALREAESYLQLAARYVARLQPPLLLIVRGLSGSGKSTLATALAEQLGLELLQTDVLRQELFPAEGDGVGEPRLAGASADGRYSPANRQRVYDHLLERAEEHLQRGCGLVLDGTFLAAEPRERAVRLAERTDARPLIIECHCPEPVARRRIRQRLDGGRSVSEAFPELVARQSREQEDGSARLPLFRVDTSDGAEDVLQRTLEHLRSRFARGDTTPG